MKKLTSSLLFIVLFLNLMSCTPSTDLKINATSAPIRSIEISTPTHVVESETTTVPGALVQPTYKPIATTLPDNKVFNGQLKVHFIDVGQADSILIQTPNNKTMLIDAGNDNDGDFVVSYIKSQGIDEINVLVGTHPHEDHIGGLDTVIDTFDIEKIYMPKVSSNTNTYLDVMNAIRNKDLQVTTAKAGVTIGFDNALKTEIIAPNSESYEDLNNFSAVIKMTFQNTSFLFTGDSESISEKEMISAGFDLQADLLKVGHHGSGFSTGALFLKKVSPKYALISVGENNSYNHPDNLVLNRLKTYGAETFRTDKLGTVVAISDGNTITLDKKASPEKSQAPPEPPKDSKDNTVSSNNNLSNQTVSTDKKDLTVFVTKSGKKYHSEGCQYLKKSKIPISFDNAKSQGFTACSRCKPPQ